MDIHEMRLAVLALADGDVNYALHLLHFVQTGESDEIVSVAEVAEVPMPSFLRYALDNNPGCQGAAKTKRKRSMS